MRAGFPVPPGWAVPADALARALRDADVDPRLSDAEALRDTIATLPLPEAWCEAWVDAARTLGPRLAVRSSGVAEDGASRSFAGQHATVLDVSPDEVPDAIRRVWASQWSEAAVAYGAGRPRGDQMAVLVQRMIAPRVSGVLFTTNPLNGSWREMVVEAVWGLGEALVSGRVVPHGYLVRRPRLTPRGLLSLRSRTRLEVMEEDLPPQTQWLPPGGHALEPTPDALRHARTLEPRTLRALCRLGLRVEREAGTPQDVEWALDEEGDLHVLQARPITASATPRPRGDVLWTRRFVGERWAGEASPLGWSIVAPVLSWFIAYPHTQEKLLGGGPPLRLVQGRPYVNATVFRHLLFKLPGAAPPRFMLELLPPSEALQWRRRHAAAPDLRVYLSLLAETVRERRWERFAWDPFTNPATWRDTAHHIEHVLAGLPDTPLSPADAVRRVERLTELLRDYVSVHVTSLLFANLSWQLLEAALAATVPDRARSLMDDLAVSPPGNATLVLNDALHDLAERAEPGDLDALARGEPLSTPFAEALDAFLAIHGHRAQASWEILSPRWRDDPSTLAPVLRMHQRGTGRRRDDTEARHARALDTLRELAPPLARPALLGLVWYTRRYLLLRENQRAVFDRLTARLADDLRWLGSRLASAGHLDTAADVRWLTWSELSDAVRSPADRDALRGWVARRRAEAATWPEVEPPTALLGDEGRADLPTGRRLQGQGLAPGRVRGPARVLRGPAEAHRLQPGDVLVARALDPSWTPLLSIASGVLVEMGGALSHGAVIAREYGVPMVGDVDGATRWLKDGDEITVDGRTGAVWLHP